MVVRALVYAVPIAVAYLVIRFVGPWLHRPAGWVGVGIWVVQAALVGALVSRAVGRSTRRFLPLATLLRTTLIFPDRAPSRFGVALRSGTVKQMRKRAHELHRGGLGSTPAEAAENAIVLVTGLGRHDRLTRGHTERVRAYADLIAEEMGLSAEDRNWLAWGVLLHDVGKMTVPSEILNKVEKLTDEEWAILRNHPVAGEEMLQPLAPWLGDWVKAAGEHHERWDGRGYPRGLDAGEISLAGRITCVADAYDVITSKRSYKEPMPAEAARRELVACAGSQFDPEVVRAFLAVSVGHRADLGPLAWITELPIVRGAVAVSTSPVANAVGAAAIAGGALLGVGDDASARRQAFADELGSLTTLEVPGDETVDVTVPRAARGAATSTTLDDGDDVPPATDDDTATPPADPTVPEPGDSGTATPPTAPDATPPGGATTTVPVVTPPTGPTTTDVPATTQPSATTTLPAVTVPTTTLPAVTVPTTTLPSVTLPSVTVPSVTVPSVTVPPTTVSSVTLPLLPGATTPPVTTPEVSTPEVTTPTLPPSPGVGFPGLGG